MVIRSLTRFGLVALVALSVAACSSSSTPAPSSGAPSASGAESAGGSAGASSATSGSAVTIQGFAFGPSSLDVDVGTTVTWTNKDSVTHTVTANDGSFDGQVASGATFSQTFAKAGTFSYHCKIHPSMTATVTVH